MVMTWSVKVAESLHSLCYPNLSDEERSRLKSLQYAIQGQPIEVMLRAHFEFFERSQMSDRERSCWKSFTEAVIASVQAFTSGKAVDLKPVCSALHDYIDISPNISESDRSLRKSLDEICCKNLQLALNGQPLDLLPLCHLLQDWISRSPHIPDLFRPLLKSIVKALESVLTGNQ